MRDASEVRARRDAQASAPLDEFRANVADASAVSVDITDASTRPETLAEASSHPPGRASFEPLDTATAGQGSCSDAHASVVDARAAGAVEGAEQERAEARSRPPQLRLPDAVHPIDPVPESETVRQENGGGISSRTATSPVAPALCWTEGAGPWRAYARGVREAPLIPAFILFVTFVGYGAMTKDAGLSLMQSVLTTLTIYALPAQVMLVDQIARGAGLIAAAFAVTVTSIRLLPLTVALLPHMRRKSHGPLMTMAIAHLVAVSMWIESMRRVPHLPQPVRVPYYFGLGTVLLGVSALGTGLGFVMAAGMPREAAAALMLMTPLYFLMGLTASALGPADRCAILCGVMLAPCLHVIAPAADLLLTGLIGGTLTYLISRWRGWKG